MKMASTSTVFLFILALFSFLPLIHSKKCNPTKGDCVAEDANHCKTGCSIIPKNCKTGIDRFGKGKKYQCHCKHLKFCDVTNNGDCNGKGCIFGYEGPNCQKRLYHEFLKSQTGMAIFGVNANNTCRNTAQINQSILFNHVYRIHQIKLRGNISVSNTIERIFGSDNQTLECKPTKGATTELLCSGDITTDRIQIVTNNSCINDIKLFGCSPGWFGEECSQKCYCQDDSDCHQLTGVCRNGCESGRHGENCQNINYVNVALGRPASQSSIERKGYIFKGNACKNRKVSLNASSVVDGNNLIFERMCSSTEFEVKPTWKVQLDKNYTISQLRIFANNRYKMTVYIGENKKPCFQGKSEQNELSLDVMCKEPQIGNSVTITINTGSAILSLCEVEVLQCLPGFYGRLCHLRCNCQQKKCDQITGSCIYDECHAQLAESFLQSGTLIAVCVILLVICLILMFKYCQVKKCKVSKKRLSEVTLISSNDIPFDDSVYIQPIATELNKQNILIYVQQKKRKLEPFSKDFSDLPCNLLYPCTEAIKFENKDKNRFQCLLPYDHSRVVLQPDDSSPSDYINASYINNKKYISTQVPTKRTTVDFWKMIWQQNCSVIVLLTNDKQSDYVQHLPEVNNTLNFGLISVQGILYTSHRHYTVSKYLVFEPKSNPFVSRTITQYNFTNWPDGLIPSKPEHILNFRQKVNSCSDFKYPLVVQSKSGAGSTGAYICLDILLEKLEQNKPLNTTYSIRSLYNDRCLIFTKRAQLEFVYDVITESMMTSGCSIDVNELKDEIDRISVKDEITCWSIADRQFVDILQPVCQGNSLHLDLLEELYSDERNMSTTNYQISLIEGYEEDKFILTISPNQEETPEFWNIINKEKCLTIVTFRDLTNEITSYLPTTIGQSLNFGHFDVELINFMDKELFQCNVLRISYTKEESFHYVIVNHYDVTFWKDKTNLPPCENMLSLVDAVSQQNSRNMPIAVHCREDYLKSGLFCAIYSTMNMVKAEESCVNIARLLRQMKKSQPQILTDPTLYTYCLSVVKSSRSDEPHYAEVKK